MGVPCQSLGFWLNILRIIELGLVWRICPYAHIIVLQSVGIVYKSPSVIPQQFNNIPTDMSVGYYTPLRVEADQKEIIINQLKGDVYNLRKNEEDYMFLQDQFKKLQHKYKLLQQDKLLADNQFRSRHQMAYRTIAQLKNQADALKAELRDRNLELGDLDADGNTLKTQLDQRNIEIERLKNDINSLLADSEQLLAERARLEAQFEGLRIDKGKLLGELKNLECDNDSVNRKVSQLERYLAGLDATGASLKQKILAFQNQNNSLDDAINALNQELAQLQRNIAQTVKHFKQLQNDLASLMGLNDKNKSQAAHFHKATQLEVLKNNDLAKTFAQSENTLRARDAQISEARTEIKNIDMENQNLNDLNNRLDEDLEACRRHLENLSLLNSQLLAQLQRYSAEDQTVRNLIDRKARVIRSRARVEESVAMSRTTIGPQSRVVRKSKIIY